jgi:hypothetical protein
MDWESSSSNRETKRLRCLTPGSVGSPSSSARTSSFDLPCVGAREFSCWPLDRSGRRVCSTAAGSHRRRSPAEYPMPSHRPKYHGHPNESRQQPVCGVRHPVPDRQTAAVIDAERGEQRDVGAAHRRDVHPPPTQTSVVAWRTHRLTPGRNDAPPMATRCRSRGHLSAAMATAVTRTTPSLRSSSPDPRVTAGALGCGHRQDASDDAGQRGHDMDRQHDEEDGPSVRNLNSGDATGQHWRPPLWAD